MLSSLTRLPLICLLAVPLFASPVLAQSPASPEIVTLFETRFPEVMNASLIGRDCADHDKEAMRELGSAADQLIKYADPKPELATGVAKVFEGQKAYENERVKYGVEFCEKRGKDIVATGLASARAMIETLGLENWDAGKIDVAAIETQLVAARRVLGEYDTCRKWTRDAEIAAQSRSETFVSIQRLVSDIKNESNSVEKFLIEKNAAPGLSERLAEAETKARAAGQTECSVRQLADVEAALSGILQRHGLQ